jgi:hypothetical protein
MDNPIDFEKLQNLIFRKEKGKIYIGHDEIDEALLGVLCDEAMYISKSRLWEILNATVINESADMALNKSLNFEHVLTAKMLLYWSQVMNKLLKYLDRN